jgi:HAD superfamily phosphoserine phosphatase-like hydrolase
MEKRIIKALDSIDYLIKLNKDRIAVLDMDNTLLKGDIGEAVHIRLLQQKAPIQFLWKDYLKLLEYGDVKKSYLKAVTELKGCSREQIIKATQYAIENQDNIIHHHENNIHYELISPKVNHDMKKLIEILHHNDFKCYVISASNDISVKYVSDFYFGIQPEFAYGVQIKIDENEILTGEIIEPAPVLDGKGELIRKLLGNKKPIFAAGDSYNDLGMFNTIDKDGAILWMGKQNDHLEKIKKEMIYPNILIVD